MTKTVLIAVGGTGGHLFPALSTADALKKIDPSYNVIFAGGGLKQPQALNDQAYYYHKVNCAPLSLRNPIHCIKNSITIMKGWQESRTLLKRHNVSMIVGFGSYYSLPLLLAAKWNKVPYILHEQNTIPGRVIRLFSKGAIFTGIHFPNSQFHLKGQTRIVGMPLRQGYTKGKISNENAKKYFSLDPSRPVLLIFGGSQGALGINKMVSEALKGKMSSFFQILHFTGSSESTAKLQNLYQDLQISACVKNFEEKMEIAWEAADCVISRAGASSIAEQIEYEVPGILIPYPCAMDNHQEFNANFFVDQVEGGIKILEGQSDKFEQAIQRIMQPANLLDFSKKIANYKHSTQSLDFAKEIYSILKVKNL